MREAMLLFIGDMGIYMVGGHKMWKRVLEETVFWQGEKDTAGELQAVAAHRCIT